MHDHAERLPGYAVTMDEDLARELEARLSESSALAVRVAYSAVRNREDAEDVAQEAFVRAYRSFQQLRDRERFRAWLVRTTWRLALDWKRGDRRRGAREEAVARLEPLFGNAESDAMQTDRSRRLWNAIDTLPERLRLALVLAAIDGHSMKDVAALIGVPEGTVKSRVFEARRLLQERLR